MPCVMSSSRTKTTLPCTCPCTPTVKCGFFLGVRNSTTNCRTPQYKVSFPFKGFTEKKPDDYSDLYSLAKIGSQALEKPYGTDYIVGAIPDLLYIASGNFFTAARQPFTQRPIPYCSHDSFNFKPYRKLD